MPAASLFYENKSSPVERPKSLLLQSENHQASRRPNQVPNFGPSARQSNDKEKFPMKIRASDYPFYSMQEPQNSDSENPMARISRANLDTIRRAVEADDQRRRSRALKIGSHAPKKSWHSRSLFFRFLRRFLP